MQAYDSSLSVAIVTPTIGRSSLIRTIESVKKQTYPCKHYLFVDGEQFSHQVKLLIDPYSDLEVSYLAMNTGANGWTNSSINAIAPYLIKEDIICYLDDDNWYEPNHIESIIKLFVQNPSLDFVYTLRNFIDIYGNFICEDDYESLGFWENKLIEPTLFQIETEKKCYTLGYKARYQYHIDTNCYAFLNKTALQLAPTWFSGQRNDNHIFTKIQEIALKGATTHQYTLNYTIDLQRLFSLKKALKEEESFEYNDFIFKQEREQFILINQENIRRHGGRPWISTY